MLSLYLYVNEYQYFHLSVPCSANSPCNPGPGRLQMRHPVMMDSFSSALEAPACTTQNTALWKPLGRWRDVTDSQSIAE